MFFFCCRSEAATAQLLRELNAATEQLDAHSRQSDERIAALSAELETVVVVKQVGLRREHRTCTGHSGGHT